ncbi:hypothetical protein EV138_7405 [Kribbella voronezhensis]|uniref:Uncharacterized protein n=1 Tax=Kribbella voronezhensis TaxID=2512212 RepID=A0A4R7STJ2_9ACTN|nr:hypothetical protein [Kribbella voronezhensis]TDU82511.1 hypothetical protein EV138_7405 [Kribbella voronezhensis]
MADGEGRRIDPESPVYREVARLYGIAQEVRPGGRDRWNGELESRSDGLHGGLTNDGTLRLSEDLVLKHLTGGERSDDPARQGDALATVLHESLHARVEMDAADQPNAVRAKQSIALDEGLTELATMNDYEEFVRQAGYEHAEKQEPKYPGAVEATSGLLDRATSSEAERTELINKALDQPVAMRWDSIADSIVRKELGDTVPPDAAHQQAARAHVIGEIAGGGWASVHRRNDLGSLVAADTDVALDLAVAELKTHYAQNPSEPYPARVFNPEATLATEAAHTDEQQRAGTTSARDQTVGLADFPPPDAATRIADVSAQSGTPNSQPGALESDQRAPAEHSAITQPAPAFGGREGQAGTAPPAHAGRGAGAQGDSRGADQQGDPMRFLNNQAPAAQATHATPSLGDGSRDAGAPGGPSVNRPTPSRTPTPDRGSRD